MEKGKTHLELGEGKLVRKATGCEQKSETSLSGIGFTGCAPPRGVTLPPFGGILNL
jgi:hypothetical protein